MQRFDREVVMAHLRPIDVLTHFSIKGKTTGDTFRTRLCPACGIRSSDAVTMNLSSGAWNDHTHGCKGGLLDMIAGLLGLSMPRDLPQVLEHGAAIAGIGPDADPKRAAEVAAKRKAEEEVRRKAEETARRRAIAEAGIVWDQLQRTSFRGGNYLRSRGLEPLLLEEVDAVRYDQDGNPMVALWSKGGLVNVVRRWIDPGTGPKVTGRPSCPTEGTLVGWSIPLVKSPSAWAQVVITEGVIDTLTAKIAFPGAIVLGAHGASRFAGIAIAAAKVMRAGELVLVGHQDRLESGEPGAGERAADAALAGAIEAGLAPTGTPDLPPGAPTVRVLELGAHKDLNDAWKAKGWRP